MEPAPFLVDRPYTEEEYLRLEAASPLKHEFRNGRIIALAGGTQGHGTVAMNLGGELRAPLKGTPCIVSGGDVGVRVARTGIYLYPDLSVVCDPPIYHPPNRRTILVNPKVVVEVLSPSTAADDLGGKFEDYMRVDSLEEYILVAQDRAWARSFLRRPDGMWAIGPWVDGLAATLTFRFLGTSVPMAEVYDKVTFPETSEPE